MPIPGTPTSVTSCGSRVRVAREKARSSTSSSSSRPTSGARPCWRTSTPTAERGWTASHTRVGSLLPFPVTGSCSRYSTTRSVARKVCSPTRIPFTGAAACIRAAVLTTSPATMPSPAAGRAPSDTSASPVWTAIRTSRFVSSAAQSRIASAARTARSGSSSCATGAPKTAITASPMNFSTVPPNRSSSARRRA